MIISNRLFEYRLENCFDLTLSSFLKVDSFLISLDENESLHAIAQISYSRKIIELTLL